MVFSDENYEDKVFPDGPLILAHRSDEGFYICNASNEGKLIVSKYLNILLTSNLISSAFIVFIESVTYF